MRYRRNGRGCLDGVQTLGYSRYLQVRDNIVDKAPKCMGNVQGMSPPLCVLLTMQNKLIDTEFHQGWHTGNKEERQVAARQGYWLWNSVILDLSPASGSISTLILGK